MTDAIQVVTTAATRADALRIAGELVRRRLAACVQVNGPISSTYWWQGNVESADEWLCVVKTRRETYSAVEQTIRELHTYDEPEILALPVIDGSAGYLGWLKREVSVPAG